MTTLVTDFPPSQREALAERSGRCIVTYANHVLPAGSSMPATRIGIGPAGLGRALYVERGIIYTGANDAVREWLAAGVRHFPNFEALCNWMATVFSAPPTSAPSPRPLVSGRPAAPSHVVTNLSEVVVSDPAARPTISETALRNHLSIRISGQEPAISVLAAGVSRHVSKPFPRKPYSAALMGSTGVGKTATARALAESLAELSDAGWNLVILDMSEFSERYSVSRLVGAPPGYIGHGDGNDLASRLAANPRTVVLFDEFEKASPVVWQSILGLLDRGRLASENHGMVAAEEAVLMFTTNIGADVATEHLKDEAYARATLRQHGFSPELVGRFSDIIAFADLTGEAMAEIAARSVSLIAADYGVTIDWVAPSYLTDLLQRLSRNKFGVRTVEHLIERDLGEQLGSWTHASARIDHDNEPVLVKSPSESEGGAP